MLSCTSVSVPESSVGRVRTARTVDRSWDGPDDGALLWWPLAAP